MEDIFLFTRFEIMRLLWIIPQVFIIGIWKILLLFILLWQAIHIVLFGKLDEPAVYFTKRFIAHSVAWFEYIFWISNKRPRLIV